jgi:hypothetical protein
VGGVRGAALRAAHAVAEGEDKQGGREDPSASPGAAAGMVSVLATFHLTLMKRPSGSTTVPTPYLLRDTLLKLIRSENLPYSELTEDLPPH